MQIIDKQSFENIIIQLYYVVGSFTEECFLYYQLDGQINMSIYISIKKGLLSFLKTETKSENKANSK